MVIKKNMIIIICLSVFISVLTSSLCVMSIYQKENNEKKPVIIIDAGHGGMDGGAVGCDGTIEKTINLQISKKLEVLCELFGYDVIMTRKNDDAICDDNCKTIRQKKVSDIKNRFKIIEENPDALFVSIHQNNYQSSKYYGAQTFYSPNSKSSMILAESIQHSIASHLQTDNTRQVKKSGTQIYLLYHTQSTAVMVECGFMSNKAEMKKLKDEEYQKEIAFAILMGINDYISANVV